VEPFLNPIRKIQLDVVNRKRVEEPVVALITLKRAYPMTALNTGINELLKDVGS